jgi:hypothetical protein
MLTLLLEKIILIPEGPYIKYLGYILHFTYFTVILSFLERERDRSVNVP